MHESQLFWLFSAFSLLIVVTSGTFTEMSVLAQRPGPALDVRALASVSHLLCPGTQPAAHSGEGTVLAWEGADLPASQQREGPCSLGSTEGPYEPHLTQRQPRELVSHAHEPLCPRDRDTKLSHGEI